MYRAFPGATNPKIGFLLNHSYIEPTCTVMGRQSYIHLHSTLQAASYVGWPSHRSYGNDD